MGLLKEDLPSGDGRVRFEVFLHEKIYGKETNDLETL
jgi:hypothetical protein